MTVRITREHRFGISFEGAIALRVALLTRDFTLILFLRYVVPVALVRAAGSWNVNCLLNIATVCGNTAGPVVIVAAATLEAFDITLSRCERDNTR